ncbi:unnamed protein product [Taenia asiatica]|uniref:Oligopeptide transporter n=1 Tax=Taenia asiatica TaxID=60517 RepID=A0A0R3W976_TAEAS|nr:unnamed protein product [Taenia asiatica]
MWWKEPVVLPESLPPVLGLVIPYFMLPDLVAENNWTPYEAGSLISYIGFANTIGRCIASKSSSLAFPTSMNQMPEDPHPQPLRLYYYLILFLFLSALYIEKGIWALVISEADEIDKHLRLDSRKGINPSFHGTANRFWKMRGGQHRKVERFQRSSEVIVPRQKMYCRRWKETRSYCHDPESNTVAQPHVVDDANVILGTPLHQPPMSLITMSSVLLSQPSNLHATEEVLGSDLTDPSYQLYWIRTSVPVMSGSREVDVEEEKEEALRVHFIDISMQTSHYKWADCLRVNVASLFLAAVACGLAPLVGRSYNLLVCVGCLFGLFSGASAFLPSSLLPLVSTPPLRASIATHSPVGSHGFIVSDSIPHHLPSIANPFHLVFTSIVPPVVVSLKSILVVELFGLDKLTNAFGHMLVIQGVASIAGAIIGGHLFDTLASKAPDFIPWVNPNTPLVYAAEVCFYFASGSFLLAALFASPLRCLATREVISATYVTPGPGVVGAGGGIYVDDYFEYGEGGVGGGEDGSAVIGAAASLPPPPPVIEPGTGSTSESAVNLVQSPAPPQLQQPQSPPSTLQPHFDSGIASYVGEAMSPGGVTATIMESVEPSLPPPPPQPTIPDPSTILSPAPLPSSLFITSTETEAQPQMQAPVDLGGPDIDSTLGGVVVDGGGGGVVDVLSDEDRGEVITTAGVPIGTLPSRSTIQPQSPQTQATSESGLTWSAPGGAPIVTTVPASAAAEVKTSLVAEEPALEPVKEEEEEEEMEEQPRVPLSSAMQPPLAASSSDIDESPSTMKKDTETVAIT